MIWQRDLRQPPVEPQAVALPVVEPKLAIRLVGTAVEVDRCFGLFQLASNATVVRPVGARIEDFEIVSIERGRALLRGAGRDYELTVPWYERLRRTEPHNGR